MLTFNTIQHNDSLTKCLLSLPCYIQSKGSWFVQFFLSSMYVSCKVTGFKGAAEGNTQQQALVKSNLINENV